MSKVFELIPKDKADIETAEKLMGQSFKEVQSIIPQLLEWIQDMNWPVAEPVSAYLLSVKEHLTPYITQILKGNDSTWKYWCLSVFGYEETIDPVLLNEIESLRLTATQMDIEEGVIEQIDKIIAKHHH